MKVHVEENIKFSVLVPVYQVEKYIDECIQSVLKQTYTNWELILVDDGTTKLKEECLITMCFIC